MWAGRVPFSQKIIGIVIAPLLLLGLTMAWWVSNELGGWLSYLLSEERVAQAMSVGMRGVIIITVFAAIGGLVIAWLLIWIVNRPIVQLTRVARQVEKGDLSLRAPIWANDEIGELGSAFNAMIASLIHSRQELELSNEQLRRRNEELAALYELARMSSQVFTVDHILSQGLEQALRITGAQAGLIAMRNGDSDVHVKVQQNLPEAVAALLHRALPDRFTAAAESGEPIVVQEMVNESALSPTEYSSVYVPIISKGQALGVLSVWYHDTNQPKVEATSLLMTVCNHLGIAIENRYLWEELQHKEIVRRHLLDKVITAQEEERRRISRELHDETGQSLTSLLVQLKLLERQPDMESMRRHAQELRELTARTLDEVRRLSLDLRPAALDDLGLVPALEWYINEYARKFTIQASFNAQGMDDIRLPREAEVVLYRVVQESLSNVVRHAKATSVHVDIQRDKDTVQVRIKDNGYGFNIEETLKSPNRGLGLRGMQERMALIGGTLQLLSTPNEGTEVCIEAVIRPEPVGAAAS